MTRCRRSLQLLWTTHSTVDPGVLEEPETFKPITSQEEELRLQKFLCLTGWCFIVKEHVQCDYCTFSFSVCLFSCWGKMLKNVLFALSTLKRFACQCCMNLFLISCIKNFSLSQTRSESVFTHNLINPRFLLTTLVLQGLRHASHLQKIPDTKNFKLHCECSC